MTRLERRLPPPVAAELHRSVLQLQETERQAAQAIAQARGLVQAQLRLVLLILEEPLDAGLYAIDPTGPLVLELPAPAVPLAEALAAQGLTLVPEG